ncbi:hypothetical protein HYV80_02480 [Candidatus Woesearchaeota archaeon]|nr:hypothetical protein [Candidatus Woesearchaeota archaeon]
MAESSELKSPFIEFDYNDDVRHTSRIKQGILYTVRVQGVFGQLGELELTPDVVTFVREPHIRSRLEDIVKGKSRFSLTSPELPFLMRAELVDAYFQHKISKHLQQFGEIEIYIAQAEREVFAKPIGTEVIRRLGKNADEALNQQIRDTLAAGTNLSIYDAVFDGKFRAPNIAAALHHEVGTQIINALVSHVSSGLAVSHLGGREAVDRTLLFHAMFRSSPASDKEEAIYYDSMRRILQVNGRLPETGMYNGTRLKLERYNAIPPAYRRVIHDYLLRNFMDAQKIQEVATIFTGEIDKNIGRAIEFSGLFGARNSGVRKQGNSFYFDNDASKDLEEIAGGAQYLLNKFAELRGTALVPLNTQTASDQRRSRHNIGILELFGSFDLGGMDSDEELPPINASNAFEFYGIADSQRQQEFYKAYRRLFGEEGYQGRTGKESWVVAVMKLIPDGRVQMAIIDDLYGRNDDVKWFNPFEYVKSDDKGVEYFRRDTFDPNMSRLKEIIDNEIASNSRVTQQLALATQGKSPVKVDEGLYQQMNIVPDTIDELANWDERIVALLPFVEQDYTTYMKTLGIGTLRDREQVTKAYHQAVIRDKAHPDLTQGTTEKIERGRRLNELIRARDELSHRLNLQSASPAYGVSMYIGNISPMLRSSQSPAQ